MPSGWSKVAKMRREKEALINRLIPDAKHKDNEMYSILMKKTKTYLLAQVMQKITNKK
jgi:hypothetical protein